MKKDLKPEYIESLRRAWQKRAQNEQKDMEKLRQDALRKASAAAEHLKKNYRIKFVYLYGSLVWGSRFTQRSDIDLLVEGFPAEMSYWRMLVELEGVADPFEVNVVLGEDAVPGLLEKVRREGKLL